MAGTAVESHVAETSIEEMKGGAEAFLGLLNSGDIQKIVSRYEKGAILVIEAGKPAVGKDAIGRAWSELLAVAPQCELHVRSLHRTGDIALCMCDWGAHGSDAEGSEVSLGGQVAVVLRKQEDGQWLMVVDNLRPFEW